MLNMYSLIDGGGGGGGVELVNLIFTHVLLNC